MTKAVPWFCVALASWVMLAATLLGQSQVQSASDEQVRSAFLFQLAQYVTWPATSGAQPVRFCVLGDDQMADALAVLLRGKTIEGRSVTTIKLSDPAQLAGCQVAFLAFTKRKQMQQVFAGWTYPPMLLVGEADGFAEMGGMVNLKINAGRISIEINLNNCRRAGLDMRSQLLRLARIVPAAGDKP